MMDSSICRDCLTISALCLSSHPKYINSLPAAFSKSQHPKKVWEINSDGQEYMLNYTEQGFFMAFHYRKLETFLNPTLRQKYQRGRGKHLDWNPSLCLIIPDYKTLRILISICNGSSAPGPGDLAEAREHGRGRLLRIHPVVLPCSGLCCQSSRLNYQG